MTLLEGDGYACTRAAASLGLFDIIAVGARDIRLVQVKSGGECRLRPVDRAAIAAFVAPANASREVWRFFDRQKSPTIERIAERKH